MYAVYSLFIVLFFVVMSPYLLYQAVRYRKYVTSLPQRLGILPVSFNMDADESIWIHAVSVGEVLTARPLISDLQRRYPALRMRSLISGRDGKSTRLNSSHRVCSYAVFCSKQISMHLQPVAPLF